MASRDSAKAGPTTGLANHAQSFCNVVFRFGFDMNRDRICAGFDKSRRVMIGMLDHEMNVERKIRLLANGRDHGRPKRNVVDKMSIHDVEMDPIGAGFFNASRFRRRGARNRRRGWKERQGFCEAWVKRTNEWNIQRPTRNVQSENVTSGSHFDRSFP